MLVVSSPSPASAWEYDLAEVTLVESGGLSDRTLAALDTFSAVLGVTPTVMQSGTIRMSAVWRHDHVVQSFAPGFAVPMAFTAVDPVTAAPLLGEGLVEALETGIVMSERTASLRGAAAGDVITVESWDGGLHDLFVSAVLPDEAIGWSELIFGTDTATRLGIHRPARAVMWGVNATVVEMLARAVLGEVPIRVSGAGSAGPPSLDGVLPTVLIKERFGEFSFRPTVGDGIEVDEEWFAANIVTVDLPRLGRFRCHQTMMPYLEGALAELEREGLAAEIDTTDFQLAGGCYNARLARGGDLDRGFALSRHAWGAAIDFNPSRNGFGRGSTLSQEFVGVLRAWGFAWGGSWRVPDPMHFEWRREPVEAARRDCITVSADPEPTVGATSCRP
ncbi:MAG TPA: M15 family metallopeptidase [Acidimicrobiia bacterium]|nr:M15 family metallopeptidase [Acidimicrobiia bacterium]